MVAQDALQVNKANAPHECRRHKTGVFLPQLSPHLERHTLKENSLRQGKVERRYVTTTDGKKMMVWVALPPNFDATKKYPTLLFCQGGPQSPLTQSYSFRWNFQLMAANGYVVVAPNRRGMPGHGVAWNEQISKDYGGQNLKDYLSAVDSVSKWPSVDKTRIGCVGASYGGYSVYMLAGMHDGRFKTFIAHCGIFDLKAMYNETEEIWFTNFDLGGAWWSNPTPHSYNDADPMKFIDKWKTPMLIISGEKDYRIPYTQSLEAYQVCQLKGIKSRLLIFPDENHWVLQPQNSLLWHREFYRWLDETLR